MIIYENIVLYWFYLLSIFVKLYKLYSVPDESCRKCGNSLYDHLKCMGCRMIFQEICMKCGQKTLPKYHTCELIDEKIILV